ncbi:DUF3299 domain-containing protein [Acuticoccus kandeliae]|uniref:DUF3299 domain-containing protein n=1 Tax=Acuticoccus kandeliae TaxID=2073160 RepID=UPI00196AADDE|nr:DUF3299 domain-containing protein [Acuticoccus kandeliae]
MLSLALRLAAVAAIMVAVIVFLVKPWELAPDAPVATIITDADGNPIPDDGTFQPVPDFNNAAPHELVRYDMPAAKETPPLQSGAVEMSWQDLWKSGAFSLKDENGERIGTPDKSLFPEGSTAEDVTLFFLDMQDMRSLQPLEGAIRPELDGKRVRIAGYTTPVGFEEEATSFLLVPVLGACIHVPPPPPNQIVYVDKAATTPEMFAPVWITGTLRADPVATILADVGYRMEDVTAEPYH